MIGRNEKCPCGSGLKYKKCCLTRNASSGSPSKNSNLHLVQSRNMSLNELSFAQIISTSYGEDLPFVPMSGKKDLIRLALKHLDQDTLVNAEVYAELDGCLSIRLLFHEIDDEFDYDYGDVDNEDHDVEDDDFIWDVFNNASNKIEVFLTETTPGGSVQVEVYYNEQIEKISRFALQVNSSLAFLWLTLAKTMNPKKMGSEAQKFYKSFQELSNNQKSTKTKLKEIFNQLNDISLSSIGLSIEPILADGTRLDISNSQFTLPDSPSTIDLKKNNRIFTETSILKQRKSGLPSLFFNVGKKQKARWHDDHSPQRLSEMVNYYFSDGAIISAQKILTTKYALLLPSDLLPGRFVWFEEQTLLNTKFDSIDRSKNDLDSIADDIEIMTADQRHIYFRDPTTAKTRQVMVDLIARIAERLARGEIQLKLNWANHGLKSGLNLLHLDLKAQPFFQWRTKFSTVPLISDSRFSIIAGQFDLEKRNGIQGEFVPLKCGFLNIETKTFTFHNVPKDIQFWNSLRYGPHSIGFQSSMAPILQVSLSAQGQKSILNLKESLKNQKLKESFKNEIPFQSSGVTAKPELHLDSSGRFKLIRHLLPNSSDKKTTAVLEYSFLNGFSTSSLQLFKLLRGGMPTYFQEEARNLASSTLKREFELKLLKHFGVVNLLIFETLSVYFHKTLSDGTVIQKSAEILPFLENKILTLLGDSQGQKLSEHCSKQVYGKLNCFASDLQSLIQKGDESQKNPDILVLPEGEIQAEGLFEAELRLIFAVLTHAVLSSNGEVFTKSRLNLFDLIFPYDDRRLNECGFLLSREHYGLESLPSDAISFQLPYVNSGMGLLAILSAFRPLLNSDFTFYIRGQKIEELQNSEFRTEMTLADAKPDANDPQGMQALNWFELNPKFFLHGKEVPLGQISQLLQEGIVEHAGKFYLVPTNRLPSLKRLSNFWERLQRGKKTKGGFSHGQQIFPVPKSQILEMLALRSSGIPVLGGVRWKQICEFYDQLDTKKSSLLLPKTINAELKPYQKQGVQWLYELYCLGLGAVLADDMGLGKTLQTLAFLEKLRAENRMGPVLIVVPTSLTYNWLSEKEKFTPDLMMQVFSTKSKDEILNFVNTQSEFIVLTTYGLMHEHKEYFQQIKWNIIIFDEAQNLKTITTQRTTTARALQSQIKICLTGTPLENHLGEFYSILDLAVPGCLGDIDEFRKIFVNSNSIEADDLRFLKLKSKPLVLRRTKQQILSELPEKTESRVALDFEDKQKKIYRDIAISYNQKIQEAILTQGESKCQLQMLTALLRLRQACSDPSALPSITYARTPPKLEALKESLLEVVESGESALVFTQFLRTLERTEFLLKEAGLPTFVIHGGLTQSSRQKVLREFNDCKGGAVLIMTLKTGGVGLNLAKASYVFHLEPWWNPAVENQATDRAHRMGQQRAVQVYRYIMHESVEEKIETLKQRKQLTFSALFNDQEALDSNSLSHDRVDSAGSFLSKEDFNFLLSLN